MPDSDAFDMARRFTGTGGAGDRPFEPSRQRAGAASDPAGGQDGPLDWGTMNRAARQNWAAQQVQRMRVGTTRRKRPTTASVPGMEGPILPERSPSPIPGTEGNLLPLRAPSVRPATMARPGIPGTEGNQLPRRSPSSRPQPRPAPPRRPSQGLRV